MASPKKDVISFISSTSLNVLACQKTRSILKSVHWIKIPSFIFLDFRLSIKQNWYEKSADEGASKNDLVPSFKLHRYLRKRSKSSQSVSQSRLNKIQLTRDYREYKASLQKGAIKCKQKSKFQGKRFEKTKKKQKWKVFRSDASGLNLYTVAWWKTSVAWWGNEGQMCREAQAGWLAGELNRGQLGKNEEWLGLERLKVKS